MLNRYLNFSPEEVIALLEGLKATQSAIFERLQQEIDAAPARQPDGSPEHDEQKWPDFLRVVEVPAHLQSVFGMTADVPALLDSFYKKIPSDAGDVGPDYKIDGVSVSQMQELMNAWFSLSAVPRKKQAAALQAYAELKWAKMIHARLESMTENIGELVRRNYSEVYITEFDLNNLKDIHKFSEDSIAGFNFFTLEKTAGMPSGYFQGMSFRNHQG